MQRSRFKGLQGGGNHSRRFPKETIDDEAPVTIRIEKEVGKREGRGVGDNGGEREVVETHL